MHFIWFKGTYKGTVTCKLGYLLYEPNYVDEILNFADEKEMSENSIKLEDKDELYTAAVKIVKSEGKASTSFLQRKLQIGYNRAARIIDVMEDEGIISKANHVGKRDVLQWKKVF